MAGIPDSLRQYRRQVILQRYEQEGSVPIARDLGITRGAVLTMAKRIGLKPYDKYKHHGAKIRAKKGMCGYLARANHNNSCNIRYFDKWSKNMAYILGFIYADGSLSKSLASVIVDVSRTDEAVLEFIKKELESTIDINRYDYSHRSKTKPFSRLCLNSTVLCKCLLAFGLKPRKSFEPLAAPSVPVEYLGSFVRGYFDGDGTVDKAGRSVRFIGPDWFIEHLANLISASADVPQPRLCKVKNTPCSTVAWWHTSDLQKIYQFMYTDCDFSLERKRVRLVQCLARPANHKLCQKSKRRH